MIQLLAAVVLSLLLSPTNDGKVYKYTFYMPLVVNSCQRSNGAALAYLGSHTRQHIDGAGLCIDDWYTYNLKDYGNRYQAEQIPFAWCHTSDYLPTLYANYETWFMAVWGAGYDGRLLLWNEIGYHEQCQMTAEEVGRSWRFYRTFAPDAKLIVGNSYGHDGSWDFKRLRWIARAIEAGGGDICDAYAIGYHDYNYQAHPSQYHQLLRRIVDNDFGCVGLPLMVTEWGAPTAEAVAERVDYYTSQDDIIQHFYFAPCQPPWDGIGPDFALFVVDWRPAEPWPQIINCSTELTPLGVAFSGE